jgi:hypothetical protein
VVCGVVWCVVWCGVVWCDVMWCASELARVGIISGGPLMDLKVLAQARSVVYGVVWCVVWCVVCGVWCVACGVVWGSSVAGP